MDLTVVDRVLACEHLCKRFRLTKTQHPAMVAYRLGAKGRLARTPPGPDQAPGASRFLMGNAAQHTATLILVAGYNKDNRRWQG